ncbi:MAG: hypothetical protein HS111_19740 [Kofleriaceae bacterium]|nr:hypothetical protein [Kofleriaceae bacterium]
MQVLGEALGDPDPTGARRSPALRDAITWLQAVAPTRLRLGAPPLVCAMLVRPLGDFAGPRRKAFCTNLAAEVAALTAEALCRFGAAAAPPITPVPAPPAEEAR